MGKHHKRHFSDPALIDLLDRTLQHPVVVKSQGKAKKMRSGEAMLRLMVSKACAGDEASLSAIETILKMGGATKEVSAEEANARTIRLPRSLTNDEFDLCISPSRGRERRWCIALSELSEGDRYLVQDRLEEAWHAFRDELNAANDPKMQIRAIGGLGLVADHFLVKGQLETALACAEEARAAPKVVMPQTDIIEPNESDFTWIELVRAYASILVDANSASMKVITNLCMEPAYYKKTWRDVVSEDVARFRSAGLDCRILEPLIGALSDAPAKRGARELTGHSREFQTAEIMLARGELLQAFEEFLQCYQNGFDRDLSISRMEGIVDELLSREQFHKALDLSLTGLQLVSSTVFAVVRAEALSLLGRNDEAKLAYALLLKDAEASTAELVRARLDRYRRLGVWPQIFDAIFNRIGDPSKLQSDSKAVLATDDVLDSDQQEEITGLDIKLLSASDIQSGDQALGAGFTQVAIEIYARCLRASAKALECNLAPHMVTRKVDDREAAIDRLRLIALEKLKIRDTGAMEDIARTVSALASHAKWPERFRSYVRVCAGGSVEEAKFPTQNGEQIGIVLVEMNQLRGAGLWSVPFQEMEDKLRATVVPSAPRLIR
jgi:hypothetical protein